MGETADGILDGSFDSITGEYLGEALGFPRTREKRYKNPNKKKARPFRWWLQADSERINICNMTNTHLERCIAKIEEDCWREQWLEPLKAELASRVNSHIPKNKDQ